MNHIPRVIQYTIIYIMKIVRHSMNSLMSNTRHRLMQYPGLGAVTTRFNFIHSLVYGSKPVGVIQEIVADHRTFDTVSPAYDVIPAII